MLPGHLEGSNNLKLRQVRPLRPLRMLRPQPLRPCFFYFGSFFSKIHKCLSKSLCSWSRQAASVRWGRRKTTNSRSTWGCRPTCTPRQPPPCRWWRLRWRRRARPRRGWTSKSSIVGAERANTAELCIQIHTREYNRKKYRNIHTLSIISAPRNCFFWNFCHPNLTFKI